MSNKYNQNLIRRVFSDAHIIDVDFSGWDKQIIVLAVSDHYESWSGRCPVVLIEFKNVRGLVCSMPPPEMMLDEPERHLQWNVDNLDIRESKGTIQLRLSGSASSPALSLECEGIEIRPVSNQMLDEVFPGWNRPFAGMVRPSIESVISAYYNSKIKF